MPTVRRRLSPDQSRARALEAARVLLIEAGPQAVTLKAVAARIGQSHANLLHHFGSASGLQKALAEHMADAITTAIGEARRGEAEPSRTVELTFDAFDAQGGGALASWMLLSGHEDGLTPVVDAIRRLVELLQRDAPERSNIAEETLVLVLTALGDSLLGAEMARALDLPPDTARRLALRNLMAAIVSDAGG